VKEEPKLYLQGYPCRTADGKIAARMQMEDAKGMPYRYDRKLGRMVPDVEMMVRDDGRKLSHMVRDQSGGEHCGSHPGDCTVHQDSTGQLFVKGRDGKQLASYEPAEYSVTKDQHLLHIHRVGDWDAEKAQEIEPEAARDRRSRRRGRDESDYPKKGSYPPPPESCADRPVRMHDGTHDMSRPGAHQATLVAINQRNRAQHVRDHGVADSTPQRGFPGVKEVSSPQDQQAGLKKLNAKLHLHYRGR
jgi:hypothetical protein